MSLQEFKDKALTLPVSERLELVSITIDSLKETPTSNLFRNQVENRQLRGTVERNALEAA
jgi:hypothetical protein